MRGRTGAPTSSSRRRVNGSSWHGNFPNSPSLIDAAAHGLNAPSRLEAFMDDTMRAWICGVGVGASAMFLLDPDRGARRRALLRDKAVRAKRKTRDAADATARDIANR